MPPDRKKKVHFFFEGVKPVLQNRQQLKQFLLSIFASEGIEVETLNFIFSTDKALHSINRKFLDHDFFTDIVTFNLARTGNPVIGDIYISIDRVRDNAAREGESFKMELHRVIFHGALHLCGYKDKSRSQTAEMRSREQHYLVRYFGNVSRDTLGSK